MKRRHLLTAGLAVAAGLAGCNTDDPVEGPTTTGTATDTPTPTRTATLDPAEAPTADGLDDYRFDVGGRANPNGPEVEEIDVSFEPAANAVVVSSAVGVGSSSCFRAGLESVLYGEETLQVAIAPEAKGDMAAYPEKTRVGCDDDYVAEQYTIRATFDGGLPDRVAVRERRAGGDGRFRDVER
jgi:hypothetical protein